MVSGDCVKRGGEVCFAGVGVTRASRRARGGSRARAPRRGSGALSEVEGRRLRGCPVLRASLRSAQPRGHSRACEISRRARRGAEDAEGSSGGNVTSQTTPARGHPRRSLPLGALCVSPSTDLRQGTPGESTGAGVSLYTQESLRALPARRAPREIPVDRGSVARCYAAAQGRPSVRQQRNYAVRSSASSRPTSASSSEATACTVSGSLRSTPARASNVIG